ncbi:MAG: hypothetical protein CMF66_04420 [Magnetovibrio sp.]|nr:hypothetical protein [Magnetovibrio sp.]
MGAALHEFVDASVFQAYQPRGTRQVPLNDAHTGLFICIVFVTQIDPEQFRFIDAAGHEEPHAQRIQRVMEG